METAAKAGAAQPAIETKDTVVPVVQPSDKPAQSGPEAKSKPMRARQDDRWKIFSWALANDGASSRCVRVSGDDVGASVHHQSFPDGETYVQIEENVRGADVFMVQPTCDPVDLHLMQLLLLIDALKRASARRITVVIPYFGYARQDRKDKPRMPIFVEAGGGSADDWQERTGRWWSIYTRRRSRDFSISR